MPATRRLTIQQALSQAKKAAKKGDVDFAKQLYAAVLQKHPDHVLAKKRLRKLEKSPQRNQARPTVQADPSPDQMNTILRLYYSGEMKKAEQACKKMLALFPRSSKVYAVLSATLIGQGKAEQALKVNDQAIELKPDYADAYNNRGNVLHELGRPEEAINCYDKALQLKPDYADAYYNRGNVLKELVQLENAISSYDKAIQLKPNYAKAYNNRGVALQELDQLEEAIKSYDKAIRLKPDFVEAYNNRGFTLKDLARFEEAKKCFERAIQLKPDFVEAYNNRGLTLQELGQVEEAIKNYDQAIHLQPDYAEAYNNRGLAFQDLGQLEEALKNYDQAIGLKPDLAEIYSNRGNALRDLGQLEKALKSYDQAIQMSPQYYSARLNRSLAWLLIGNFQRGWPEYELRFNVLEGLKRTFHKSAAWQGEPLADKTVFVYPEQGFGDIFQFMRYLPLIKKVGGKVIFEVRQPLVRLMDTFKGYDQLWSAQQNGALMNKFDYHAPLPSLPGLFNTTLENIPSASPYISADNKLIRMWQTRIASKELFKVGIVWAASEAFKKNHLRSIPLSNFKVLNDIKGLKLFSLQKDKHAKWTDIDPGEVVDIDLGAEISDFADTAAIIENLDLVVSVDTSVAHLAGALGKEVWTLLPFSPDWRWMLNRSDSPWYPSMRLFRPPSVCDWKSVLQEVRKALVQRSAMVGNKVVP